MSPFTEPLRLEFLDGRFWRLTSGFRYVTDSRHYEVNVPEGFVTDFASIPRLLQVFFPPTGRYGKAAVLHDYLYRKQPYTYRVTTDGIFLAAMKESEVDFVTRWTLWLVVRLFGGRTWQRHRWCNKYHS